MATAVYTVLPLGCTIAEFAVSGFGARALPYDLRSELGTPRHINDHLDHRLTIRSLQSDSFWRLRRVLPPGCTITEFICP